MKTKQLEQSYKDQLVKAGVDLYRAEQAAKALTWEQLQVISEIWPAWAAVFPTATHETQGSHEKLNYGLEDKDYL